MINEQEREIQPFVCGEDVALGHLGATHHDGQSVVSALFLYQGCPDRSHRL